MERRWVIVAFGDIRGFMTWTRRGVNTPEIQDPFITKFYGAMEDFVRENDAQVKYLGDGMMILKELPDKGHSCGLVREYLKSLLDLTRHLLKLIHACPYPPPQGWRIRIVMGHVGKIMVLDGQDPTRKRIIAEYVGYAINLAERLLEIWPEKVCLCHGSAVKVLGPKKKQFHFKKVEPPQERRRGVDPEDLDDLWHLPL